MWGSECRFPVSRAIASDLGYAGKTLKVATKGGRSECRFSGAHGVHRCGVVNVDLAVSADHGCGVANANFPFLVRWPAMWGREERRSRWPTKGVGENADLVVCPASIDVV